MKPRNAQCMAYSRTLVQAFDLIIKTVSVPQNHGTYHSRIIRVKKSVISNAPFISEIKQHFLYNVIRISAA